MMIKAKYQSTTVNIVNNTVELYHEIHWSAIIYIYYGTQIDKILNFSAISAVYSDANLDDPNITWINMLVALRPRNLSNQ